MAPFLKTVVGSCLLVALAGSVPCSRAAEPAVVKNDGRVEAPRNSSLQSPEAQQFTAQLGNGEFPGWKSFHEKSGTKTGDVWQLRPDGVLVCRGLPKGYLYTEKDYTDFGLTLEWRYVPGAKQANGGVLVRTTGEHRIWPKSLELQLNLGQAGDFWALQGYEFSGPPDRMRMIPESPFGALRHLPRRADAEKPAGEWNRLEATVNGDRVVQKVNGVVVNEASGCEIVPGRIVLTAEGQEIHFRNVRLSPK